MMLLDTNVLSELMQSRPDARVVRWLDAQAADAAAALAAERRRQGRPVDTRDTFIAGIAVANRATVVTRNTRHFSDLPVPVINPWAVAGGLDQI